MRIVLSGALPRPTIARELLKQLKATAPQFVSWLETGQETVLTAPPDRHYCTPVEFWYLHQAGFQPEDDQHFSAGLGPWQAVQHRGDANAFAPDEAVWLVSLAHYSPSRDGAVLIPGSELAISDDHSQRLFDSVTSLFQESHFTLTPLSTTNWQVKLPDDLHLQAPSPTLVSQGNLNDWWSQDTVSRPWRRLANECQMLWFDHDVNQERQSQGQAPINGLWLYGGATPAQFTALAPLAQDTIIDHGLLKAHQAQDWGGWLAHLQQLEQQLFTSLEQKPELILTGEDRVVTLAPKRSLWQRLRPGHQHAWKKWWTA